MTEQEFKALDRGDIIRNIESEKSYVVDQNLGDRAIAIRSVDVTNPSEWILTHKAILIDVQDNS
jgi:hypothetical protein